MIRVLAFAALFAMLPRFAPGQQGDEAAIRAIVNHWRDTWEKFDASALEGDYAENADWLNAFGVRIEGGPKIVAFMRQMVKRPNVQGRHTIWEEPRIRFLRPDVAVAYLDYKTVGHKLPNGIEMPQRNTHSTWVLAKDAGGWRIASQVIYDDNSSAAAVPPGSRPQ